MNSSQLFLMAGGALALLGLLLRYAPWLVNWFGHLPGDINIQTENSRIFIPITSMIVVSAVWSLLANWFFRK